jgi:hypothetical protein
MHEAQRTVARAGVPSKRTELRAFGLGLSADVPLPGAWVAAPLAEPILHLRSASEAAIAERWSGLDAIGWEGMIDGVPFVAERGRAGDHRFVHGEPPNRCGARPAGSGAAVHGELPSRRGAAPSTGTRAVHHLSADAALLLCGADAAGEPLRWRAILDSVLFSAALLRGYEALHAGAVATEKGAVAITAAAGAGKSTLLVELLRGGCSLLCDDVVVLESRGEDAPLAHPGPPLMTVPAGTAPLPGDPIASVGEERWVAVPAHPGAIPLAALVVLNRAPGLATSLYRVRDPLAVLIGSLLRFPRLPERERARFEVAGSIASRVPIWELSADPSVTPDTLAGLLRAELIDLPGARGQSCAAVARRPYV